jgi:hypothetical protein
MNIQKLSEILTEGDYLGSLDVERMILLKLIFVKQGMRFWTGLNWLRMESSGGLF